MPSIRPLLAATLALAAMQADARDRIQIVGSASALAFTQPVAEQFARHWRNPMPLLEATGNGAGFGLFCAGVGFGHPDAVAASRRMTDAERETCAANGVTDITEIEFGRDAMVLINAGGEPAIAVTRAQLFAALAAEVERDGKVVPNRSRRWDEIDASLPDHEIRVMGPEANTSVATAFQELALAGGCTAWPAVAALPGPERELACRSLRRDDALVPGAKLEAQVLDWLEANPRALAVTAFSVHQHFGGRTAASPVEGVAPTPETLGNGRYPLTTGYYLYVKDRHVRPIPTLQQFLYELSSERAIGPEGYLQEHGLVSLDDRGRNRARDEALRLGL
jgi:phosphate transport system substrate-binding protein